MIESPPFDIGTFALSPRFPAVRFGSYAEFQEYLNQEQPRLDARESYESSLASREPEIIRSGTCAPCLRPAVFTSATAGGEAQKDGSILPNWREAQHCGCRERLNSRQRALLHFVQATGVLPWARLLLLGPASPLDARLKSMAGETVAMRERVNPEGEGFHMAVSQDHLHHAPQLDAVLASLSARLLDGGRLIFTVPFHFSAAKSEPLKPGWDMLEMLKNAGFRDAAAYLYWSEELGYLGPRNFIFRAVK